MGLFDSFFSPNPPTPSGKSCTGCFWSGYQGKICRKPVKPAPILNVGHADLCVNYTTTPPTFDSTTYTAVEAVKTAVDENKIALLAKPTFSTVTASDNLLVSSDAEIVTTLTVYTKFKEFRVQVNGKYRVTFDLTIVGTYGTYSAFGQVWKNGAPYGVEATNNSGNWHTRSDDLDFVVGDLVQLYGKVYVSGIECHLKNFRLYGSISGNVAFENPV